jgi:hypothetical protein
MSAQPAGSATTGTASAPFAPGRLGEAAPVAAMVAYLEALADWSDRRKVELDRIDAASLRSGDPDAYTADVTLSMVLWQSVSDRQPALLRAWDGGRADLAARERMSQLIWGRLDGYAGPPGAAATGGLSLSLVEACRLSDALASQLRTRLAFDPSAADGPARVAALRAALERMRELVKQEPSWGAQLDTLALRTNDVAVRASRGGDVEGVLKQLETDAARAERDLIVTTATRREGARAKVRAAQQQAQAEREAEASQQRELREAADRLAADLRSAGEQVVALKRREQAARSLVRRCVEQIDRAPRFAVPEVDVLGPVPAGPPELAAYLSRLSDVARAMDVVERAYGAPLAERDELRGRLDGYRVMAGRTGRDGDPPVVELLARARAALAAVPCDVAAAAALVEQYIRLIRPAGVTGSTPRQE